MLEPDDDKTRTHVQLVNGTMVSHYRIIEKIGAGGMGEVYRAHDDLLDRLVAIKFLSAQGCGSEDYRRRFLREARAAARLRHQNIVLTLDLGDYQGTPYIVFELLDTRTLRQRMKEAPPLTMEGILEISIELVDAVGAAHLKGVIHRDIKPSNILIDAHGVPKLVDFGLAILTAGEADTRTAGIAGTIGYMSPEQANGADADERSDLFSLGVVIYEMVTGVNPFRKDTEVASLNALLYDEPRPVRQYRDDVPARLCDIVMALLQKDSCDRYQCAEHLREDLLACGTPTTAVGPLRTGPFVAGSRLAVLSFDVVAKDDADNRTGEMIAHLIITGLSDIPQISVVSGQRLYDLLSLEGRREVQRIDRSVATRLARRAEARWMLLGTVITQLPMVLTTQLVDVSSGLLVKGHRFALEGGATIFDAVDDILATLKEDLIERGSGPIVGLVPVTHLTTDSPEALRHYLLGHELQARWNEEEAKEEYEKAIACDPMFAMAYYGLACIPVPNRMALIERAEALADRATFRERCYIKSLRFRLLSDQPASIAVLMELLERHSDEKLACYWIGVNFHYMGDYKEAIRYLRKTIELDPLFAPAYNQLVYTLNQTGQFEESILAANQYIQLTPNDSNPYDSRAEVLGFNGRLEAALTSYGEAISRQPLLVPSLLGAGTLYVLKQDYESARELFDRLPALVRKSPWVDPHIYQVTIPLRQGKWRSALKYLDEGIAEDSQDASRAVHVGYKHELKAVTCLEMGLNDDALTEIDLALHALETEKWIRKGMNVPVLFCWILARNGEVSRANDVIESQIGPGSAHEIIRRMFYLLAQGLVRCETGELDRAVELLEQAEAVKPRWPSCEHFLLQGMLARVCLHLGRLDRAVEMLEASMRVFASSRIWLMLFDVKNHYYLGTAYEQSGWTARAMAQYRILLDIWKDAEPGLQEIEDAKSRLARLQKM